jgi:hypothetical protein
MFWGFASGGSRATNEDVQFRKVKLVGVPLGWVWSTLLTRPTGAGGGGTTPSSSHFINSVPTGSSRTKQVMVPELATRPASTT